MDDFKKYVLIIIVLVLGALFLPPLITLIGIAVSPVIGFGVFAGLLFVITVILAYKNKIGRK